MPGVHAVLSREEIPLPILRNSFNDLLHDDRYRTKEYYATPHAVFAMTAYDSYPSLIYQDQDKLILMEGLIYNRATEEVRDDLLIIATHFCAGRNFRHYVSEFISAADGDYIVLIFSKRLGHTVVFNDRLARLPAYYYSGTGLFAVSREPKFIAHCLPVIEFDRVALAEFISFEYTFGAKTILRGVRKLSPATLLIQVDRADGFFITEEELLRTDFSESEEKMNRKDAIRECARLFRDSLVSRVRMVDQLGLSIMADVSGGYDSRAVFAGLCGMNTEFTSWCSRRSELGEGDETIAALELCRTFGKDLNTYDAPRVKEELPEMRRQTYICDCMVEYRTTAIRYHDSVERRRLAGSRPYANFMGFAGEFLRHPYELYKGYRSVGQMISDGAYSVNFNPTRAAPLVRVNPNDLVDVLEAEVAKYPESRDADRLKHYYFDFWNRKPTNGEDRHRLFNWTVSPFWGSDLFLFEMHHLRQEWVGWRFFTDFLREIDPRTLLAPIKGSHVNLDSRTSVLLDDARYRFRHFVGYRRPFVRLRGNPAFRAILGHGRQASGSWVEHELVAAFDRSTAVASYFDAHAVRSLLSHHCYQHELWALLSVMLYVEELENRFGGKLR